MWNLKSPLGGWQSCFIFPWISSVFLDKFWRTLLEHIAAPAMTQWFDTSFIILGQYSVIKPVADVSVEREYFPY
jgi:hypothetical protein